MHEPEPLCLSIQCGDVLYEKRHYEKAHWACITVHEDTYKQSICYGFMKLMRCICQQNSSGESKAAFTVVIECLFFERHPCLATSTADSWLFMSCPYLGMTIPILTVIRTDENHSVLSSDVTVAYYLPTEYQALPPEAF